MRPLLSACAAILAVAACRNREPADAGPVTRVEPVQTADVVVHPSATTTSRLTVHHASQLVGVDLDAVESLDLAMSSIDQVGYLAELDASTTCESLDLVTLAERLPRLTSLRISGCQASVQAGLGAFGPRLQALTLADLSLDPATVDNLRALTRLSSLTLARVTVGTEALEPLRELPMRRLVLSNLDKDSPLARLLSLWPRTLEDVVLEGEWAGHDAMTALSKAESAQTLELRGTRVGNFSLNQIKPLSRLRDVTFEGTTFNDNSTLYFRDLPVTRFVCNCPRIGDGALRSLRHTATVEQLELRDTSITPEGLAVLAKLEKLQELVLLDRDIGSVGFAALKEVPRLRRLELSGAMENPRLPGLGELTGLQILRLRSPRLDDRVIDEIAKLRALEILDLRGTRISDIGLEALAELGSLRELHLGGTRVTNRGLAHLAGLANLEVLALDHTDVVDDGIAAFEGHTRLRELRLDATLVTDACLETVRSMRSLERLSLADTVITRSGLARLADHPSLQAIDIDGIRE